MPIAGYRIHRMKDAPRQQFRLAPHMGGSTTVKPKDYEEPAESIEAPSLYAAWAQLKEAGRPLEVGDILELENGELRIVKYIGFETAEWWVPPPPEAVATDGIQLEQGRLSS